MIDADHFETTFNTVALGRFLLAAQRAVGLAGEVNVLITSNQQMRRLNREFRGTDRPTDVLSFPSAGNQRAKIAGDIAISAQMARANAETLGHAVESEVKVLLLHGLLHLAGFDHESDNGRMARREHQLRTQLKLPTGLIERTGDGKGIAAVMSSAVRNGLKSSPSRRSGLRRRRPSSGSSGPLSSRLGGRLAAGSKSQANGAWPDLKASSSRGSTGNSTAAGRKA